MTIHERLAEIEARAKRGLIHGNKHDPASAVICLGQDVPALVAALRVAVKRLEWMDVDARERVVMEIQEALNGK